jgi:hypothetical protein
MEQYVAGERRNPGKQMGKLAILPLIQPALAVFAYPFRAFGKRFAVLGL